MIKRKLIKVCVQIKNELNIDYLLLKLIDDVSLSKSNIILNMEEKIVIKKKCC